MFDNVANFAVASKTAPSAVTAPYAFTEVVTVTWSHHVDVADPSSDESKVWAKTLQTYSAHGGTSAVWWGKAVKLPEIFKLIVDWRSVKDYQAFHSSPEFAQLLDSWASSPTPISTDSPLFFQFPSDQRYRQDALQTPPTNGPFKDAVTVFVCSHFAFEWTPDAIEPLDTFAPQRPRKVVWDNSWMLVRQAALRSSGAWVSDKALESWGSSDLDGRSTSFLGILRFENTESAQGFLETAQDEQNKSADSSFEKLKRLASQGFSAEVIQMVGGESSAM